MDNVLSIFYDVYINGNKISKDRMECVDSIDIVEDMEGSDTATLVINDPDFLYISDNIFIEDATIKIECGWNGETYRAVFSGYISAIDIDFPSDGFPVLTINCLDKTHLMNRKKKKRSWDNVTRPQVVEKIAREYGFGFVYTKGYSYKKEENIAQSNATDIDFIEQLAGDERDKFYCKLIGSTIYYEKLGMLAKPSAHLHYREYPWEVVSFSPQINKETRQIEIEKSDIQTSSKTVDTGVANSNNVAREVQGSPTQTTDKPKNSGKKYDPVTKKWVDV